MAFFIYGQRFVKTVKNYIEIILIRNVRFIVETYIGLALDGIRLEYNWILKTGSKGNFHPAFSKPVFPLSCCKFKHWRLL